MTFNVWQFRHVQSVTEGLHLKNTNTVLRWILCPQYVGRGIIKWWPVSVCLSVACLDLTWPRKPKISRMEAHHTGNPWTYLEIKKGQRSRSPGRLCCHRSKSLHFLNLLVLYVVIINNQFITKMHTITAAYRIHLPARSSLMDSVSSSNLFRALQVNLLYIHVWSTSLTLTCHSTFRLTV